MQCLVPTINRCSCCLFVFILWKSHSSQAVSQSHIYVYYIRISRSTHVDVTTHIVHSETVFIQENNPNSE